jgi:tRNA threonylcarbamoyl adenosine modification protein YeaZ
LGYLALDCTGETYGCGLLTEGGQFTEVNGLNPRRALLELPAHVAHLMGLAKLDYRQLKGVGVPLGPGSFTGVRLGITLAKTVAYSSGCGLCAVDTLDCLADRCRGLYSAHEGSIAVALDARRGELYCGIFPTRQGEAFLPTDVREPGIFLQEILKRGDVLALIGAGFAAYPALIPPGFQGPVAAGRAETALGMYTLALRTKECAQAGSLEAPGLVSPAYHRQADIQVSG